MVPLSGVSCLVIIRNSVVLPAPFGPITPTMPPGGNLNVRSSIRTRSAKGLLLAGQLQELLVALIARLGFGLACFRRGRDPFLLALQRALMRCVLAAFLRQALLLLRQPGGVVALVGNALAAVEFENPARYVVEEIAVMGDDQDRTGIVAQMAFQP